MFNYNFLFMKRSKTYDDFFNVIDSEIKAYLLGFFIADGNISMNARCVNSYKFGITLTESDGYVVKWYRDNICPERTITHYHSANGAKDRKPVYAISWTSTAMKEYFETIYNIVPRKTFDLEFVFPFDKIPKEYIWDFIRGFFDGDGQISYNDTSHVSTFALYATSYKFLEQIGSFFEKEFGVEMRIEGTKKSKMILYCLRFNAHYNKQKFYFELYNKFYVNKQYYLTRKEEKLKKYLMFKYRVNQEDFERLFDNVEHRE